MDKTLDLKGLVSIWNIVVFLKKKIETELTQLNFIDSPQAVDNPKIQ
jgi:hypothetical protein